MDGASESSDSRRPQARIIIIMCIICRALVYVFVHTCASICMHTCVCVCVLLGIKARA